MQLKPQPDETRLAGAVPSEAVIIPAKRKTSLEVQGPGILRVRAWGLMKKSGHSLSAPGSLRVWVGTVRRMTLALSDKALDDVSVTGKPRWRVGEERELSFPITEGTHTVSILHQNKKGAIGYALLVQVDVPTVEPPTDGTQPNLAQSNAGEVGHPSDAGEPTLVAGEPKPAVSDPDMVDAGPDLAIAEPSPTAETNRPQAEPGLVSSPVTVTSAEPGLEIAGVLKRHTITAAGGSNEYYQVAIDPGLALNVVGPGTVLLTIHAHRSQMQPQTLSSVVLGILLDDVLVQTLALDQPASEDFRTPDPNYQLSQPVAVRVPIPVGAHKLQMSLSDTAVLGASVRPDFVAVGNEEPPILGIDAARKGDLRTSERPQGGVSFAILGGTWAPNAFAEVGGAGLFEANFAIPISSSQLLIHFVAGYGMADASRQVADFNSPEGVSRVRIGLTTVPVLLGATWSAPTPASGLLLEVGASGGAILTWAKTRYRRVDADSGPNVTPALNVLAGAGYRVGPGCVLARVYVTSGIPWSSDNIDGLDPGAVMAAVGYRLEL
ncbi:MAG: hypothetical protein A2289_11885 [Deltaproteobacteria bacterium RIFOXYA12_FULL_58_15]|nr:MAG: hypothetical protein A2289_11885 [Deltaproteobacteria bacterium RIFOXYA12_FULL_58_15]OGR13882.1 MAG: hypothetical protein A2341_25690 [Deltaproteobacteria bacterium RIFOXYB12_FULL_58_9]